MHDAPRQSAVIAAPLSLTSNSSSVSSGIDAHLLLEALTALRRGDFSVTLPEEAEGLAGRIAEEMNAVVEIGRRMCDSITGVSRAVGREGRLRQRAPARGMTGGWADAIEAMNTLIDNLARPATELAQVIGAVASGDLSRKITSDVGGDILYLKNTINGMVDQLAGFASEVSRVAREVGSEGRLGGQARVSGASGIWRDLTENVNQLAANLTTQVRAISEVATSVTRGDLSRVIQVEASGEVAQLKDRINGMILALRETTRRNAEQDWLNASLARFTRLLQEERDLATLANRLLCELAPLVSAQLGAFYSMDTSGHDACLTMVAGYGCRCNPQAPVSFAFGEGLVGQCALEKRRILLTDVPAGYLQISSGLGSAPPSSLVVLPIVSEQGVTAVIELASFGQYSEIQLSLLDQLMESIAVVLNTLEANRRTESLLAQSQSLAGELQRTNMELAEKARLLAEQNIEVERKNVEVEDAKRALEEKATQLALSSRYKSDFLANMSHELRTPLNSLLILAEQLADNPTGSLDARQVEFARTIHASGTDLLTLINDILDLSKIESGKVTMDISEYRFDYLRAYVERTFRHMADVKGLHFELELAPDLPPTIFTDVTRMQQILRNLLSNAFKFTARGSVALKIGRARSGWSHGHEVLAKADAVLAFTVTDTGIGIPGDKLRLIFEAFQQADGGTARKYGGTGLGLSISRELARLLGGEIRVESELHAGSSFTLYLPQHAEHQGPVWKEAPTPAVKAAKNGKLLIVDSDTAWRSAIEAALKPLDASITAVENGGQALNALKLGEFDCMVFDPRLSDIDGLDLLDMIDQDPGLGRLTVLIHTAAGMEPERLARLEKFGRGAAAVLFKDAASAQRLAAQAAHALRPAAGTGRMAKTVASGLAQRDAASVPDPMPVLNTVLVGRRVLIVDDDLRNIFALSSLLERQKMLVQFAENGRAGIESLTQHPEVDIVLMDVMMPEMDGYDTMRAIRRMPEFANLPIIALTAKAMKEDREKCIAAGASDYIAKPVDSASLLRVMSAYFST